VRSGPGEWARAISAQGLKGEQSLGGRKRHLGKRPSSTGQDEQRKVRLVILLSEGKKKNDELGNKRGRQSQLRG